MLPEFSEPFHGRPLTFGEIGCFMSHYNIWLEIVERNLDTVLVLEAYPLPLSLSLHNCSCEQVILVAYQLPLTVSRAEGGGWERRGLDWRSGRR